MVGLGEGNNRKIVNSEPLVERDEEPRTSGEDPQNRYWLRSRSGKSCDRMIQGLIGQNLISDSESEEEICGALHNANTSHHLHSEIRTSGNDVEMTAGQRGDTGNPKNDVLSETGDAG